MPTNDPRVVDLCIQIIAEKNPENLTLLAAELERSWEKIDGKDGSYGIHNLRRGSE